MDEIRRAVEDNGFDGRVGLSGFEKGVESGEPCRQRHIFSRRWVFVEDVVTDGKCFLLFAEPAKGSTKVHVDVNDVGFGELTGEGSLASFWRSL